MTCPIFGWALLSLSIAAQAPADPRLNPTPVKDPQQIHTTNQFPEPSVTSKAPVPAADSRSGTAGPAKKKVAEATLASRTERFTKLETLTVGEFAVDLCRRDDGAFGVGEIRRGTLPLRRSDFLINWQVDGKYPVFDGRKGLTLALRDPPATLKFTAETRECAGTHWSGFRMGFQAERGPLIETASWELGGSTRGLTYFDGYRRVKDRMVHRCAHADGSGYTWTNDRDRTKVVWLLKDAPLPDGRRGQAGQVHVME